MWFLAYLYAHTAALFSPWRGYLGNSLLPFNKQQDAGLASGRATEIVILLFSSLGEGNLPPPSPSQVKKEDGKVMGGGRDEPCHQSPEMPQEMKESDAPKYSLQHPHPLSFWLLPKFIWQASDGDYLFLGLQSG